MTEGHPNRAEVAGAPALGVREFFDGLRGLSPLRIIQITGPSVFETICDVESFSISDGWLNAITPQYHWHLSLERFKCLTTRDTVHDRSGRRVLFFELRESTDEEPFLLIYLHRAKGAEFEAEREAGFASLHGHCSRGAQMVVDR